MEPAIEPEIVQPEIIQPEEKKFLKWNPEFNPGNVLTILVVLIAACALFYQKKLVDTKVEDLRAVVTKLEEEKNDRELQGIQGEIKTNHSFSYSLGYTIDQLRATGKIYDYEFMFMLTEFNDLIDLTLTRKDISPTDRKRLEVLKSRNVNKQQVFANGDAYTTKIIEFEQNNEPKKTNYKTTEEYNTALSFYNDTLAKHINILMQLLDSFTKEPIKNVKQNELEYLELIKKK